MGKTVSILGSTGSIGCSTLRVIESLGGEFEVYGIGCSGSLALLRDQIAVFSPAAAAVESDKAVVSDEFASIRREFPAVEFLTGSGAMEELASRTVDVCVSAVVGAAGLRPSLSALRNSRRVALANKETLVMAGGIVMQTAAECAAELIPVDSEHSAVLSLLGNVPEGSLERIILTASGGGLRDCPLNNLSEVTPEMALAHPTWDMGRKITIDSATLVNKGLEVIEAHYLFDVPYSDISVLIHPESVIHSLVETVDGSLFAHMGVADMALPILSALKYPEKVRNKFGRLRLEDIGSLNFREFDRERYPALELCYEAGIQGGTMPAVLNAANEAAVEAFLDGNIAFTDITRVIENAMKSHMSIQNPSLEDIFDADYKTRRISAENIRSYSL